MAKHQKTILGETRKLLSERRERESRASIAENSGVNRHWLEKFDQGVLNNPTFENLDKLRSYLLQTRDAA